MAFPTEGSDSQQGGGGSGGFGGGGFGGQQAQQQEMVVRQDTYLDQRANAMQDIEKNLVEIGGIFTRLNTILAEHQDNINIIDDNVNESVANMEAGESQLMKYYDHVTSGRGLALKLFMIIATFMAFFIIFLA